MISNNINNAPNQDSINKNIIKFSFNNEIHEIINKNNGKDLINSTEEIISSILLIINLEKTFRNLAPQAKNSVSIHYFNNYYLINKDFIKKYKKIFLFDKIYNDYLFNENLKNKNEMKSKIIYKYKDSFISILMSENNKIALLFNGHTFLLPQINFFWKRFILWKLFYHWSKYL